MFWNRWTRFRKWWSFLKTIDWSAPRLATCSCSCKTPSPFTTSRSPPAESSPSTQLTSIFHRVRRSPFSEYGFTLRSWISEDYDFVCVCFRTGACEPPAAVIPQPFGCRCRVPQGVTWSWGRVREGTWCWATWHCCQVPFDTFGREWRFLGDGKSTVSERSGFGDAQLLSAEERFIGHISIDIIIISLRFDFPFNYSEPILKANY